MLARLKQNGDSVSVYFNKWKRYWDELGSVISYSACKCCKCGESEKMKKMLEEDKLLDFLMGLNKEFVNVRGNILMMSPLPSLESGYALILSEERQRDSIKNRKEEGNSSTFANSAGVSYKPQQKLEWQNENRSLKVPCSFCGKMGA